MAGAGVIRSPLLGCDWLTASPNLTRNHGHSPGAGKLRHHGRVGEREGKEGWRWMEPAPTQGGCYQGKEEGEP